jgi:hypothetical protein
MKQLFTIMFVFIFSMISFTQTEPVQSDKIYMVDGKTLEGKVNLIKDDVVQFTDKETGIDYEINKSDIKVIVLASGKPIVFDEPVSEPKVETIVAPVVAPVETAPVTETPTEVITEPVPEIQFSLAGYLAGSIQNWSVETEESTIGFGLAGDLFAGIIWEEMYFGLGPHFGGSWWTLSESIMGYDVSATTSVSDFGLDLVGAWEGFFFTLGWGSGNVSITATVEGQSETYDVPESIGYTRIMLGWYDSFLFGIAFVSYEESDTGYGTGTLASRGEITLGWAF